MEERRLSFLESIATSAIAGAVSGTICGAGRVSEETQKEFTGILVNTVLNIGNKMKQRDKEGYFPGINP